VTRAMPNQPDYGDGRYKREVALGARVADLTEELELVSEQRDMIAGRATELEAALRETITEWAAERGSKPSEYRHWEQVSTEGAEHG
jgi:hypothetical protein